MALDERLTRLEMTVAGGLSELHSEMGSLGGGLEMSSLESRLRVLIEASRDEHRQTAKLLGAGLERIEARLALMHQEHRQVHDDHTRAMQDHERRIRVLERRRRI